MQATMSRQDAIGNPEFHGVRNAYLQALMPSGSQEYSKTL